MILVPKSFQQQRRLDSLKHSNDDDDDGNNKKKKIYIYIYMESISE